ncbi:VAMP-like protein YKT62 [Panicum miliaceum]|uniref:VAMP-like protein YKT62 n=1 Tax=Panicum miliaceum TaxID=4540 RepID=A0A3L6PK88_PANMI|nr:VAMP-like protein YKT62 [Panicum miliaceum]
MKITALLVLKPSTSGAGSSSSGGGSGPEAVVLADAIDVSHFGYFQRNAACEFIVFIAKPSRSAPSSTSGSPSSTKEILVSNLCLLCEVIGDAG